MALFAPEDGAPTQSTVLPSDVLNSVKRIKNRCASYRQHPLPHRRAASRSKPPKTPPPVAKLVIVVSRRIAWRRITLRLHANVALPSGMCRTA
ncbi:hypothetical protein Q9L42_018140 [Methylomarinum sp. Ch1-1]|uniref:Uncharacterized protein n=1 Tax=Methylomarinum roseum TaxID=3067653 RepID=A0AAU7NTG2_9GAMM